MSFKKIFSFIFSFVLLFNSSYCQKVTAVDPVSVSLAIGAATSVASFIFGVIRDGTMVLLSRTEVNKLNEEISKYKGFRPREETTKMIIDIINGTSPIRIYGQENAKMQCRNALAGCLENIYGNPSEIRGNVVYMIGDSGVGKTTMAKALANAFLVHSDKTCIFMDSSQINNEQPLGEQLLKTITKTVNLKKNKNWKNLWGHLDIEESNGGAYDIRVASPMLDHILKWVEVVIVVDELDKMKMACVPSDASEEFEDRSFDEIIKSIAANGEYYVGNQKIDCRKALFIITTNETKQQLYENFGYRGSIGGGVQRINIIEFEKLSFDCCRRIINDMVGNIKKNLTNRYGDYKIKHVDFSEETLNNMATYIYNDRLKQARAKFDLEQNIYALFCYELNQNVGKSFEVVYTAQEEQCEDEVSECTIGNFSKLELGVTPTLNDKSLTPKNVVSFTRENANKLVSYTINPHLLVNYSRN